MCNCNKPSARPRPYNGTTGNSGSAKQNFELVLKGTGTQRFGSRLEADAANARAGYRGIVRPLPK